MVSTKNLLQVKLTKGSFVGLDRGYMVRSFSAIGISGEYSFVRRLKGNPVYCIEEDQDVPCTRNILEDQVSAPADYNKSPIFSEGFLRAIPKIER